MDYKNALLIVTLVVILFVLIMFARKSTYAPKPAAKPAPKPTPKPTPVPPKPTPVPPKPTPVPPKPTPVQPQYTAADIQNLFTSGIFVYIFLRNYLLNRGLNPAFTGNFTRLIDFYRRVTGRDLLSDVGLRGQAINNSISTQIADTLYKNIYKAITNYIPNAKTSADNQLYAIYTLALESQTSNWINVYPNDNFKNRARQDTYIVNNAPNRRRIDELVISLMDA